MIYKGDRVIVVNGPFRGAIGVVAASTRVFLVKFFEKQGIESLQVKIIDRDLAKKRRYFYVDKALILATAFSVTFAKSRYEKVGSALMPKSWVKKLNGHVREKWSEEKI
jgi:ribosomal protein L24